jgi:hypothetical protein
MFHAEKYAPHVGAKYAVEDFAGVCDARSRFSANPCVVKGEVESTEAFDRSPDQCRDFFLAGHIRTYKQALAASFLHKCDRLRPLSLSATRDDDVGALLGKSDRRCSPNSRGSTGDQHDFSFK